MIQKLSKSEPMIAVAREILGESAEPVRGILFDKTPAANCGKVEEIRSAFPGLQVVSQRARRKAA
jgi:hypothetical protein